MSRMPCFICVLVLLIGLASPSRSARAQTVAEPSDPRFFSQTNFRVDNDAFWNYFQARGGVPIFGYPVSRDFLFLGCTTQVFQRVVLQQCGPSGGVALLNLLDSGLMPYTQINGSTLPGPDLAMKAATPPVSDPNYAANILDFVQANAPDVWNGQPVNFGSTFFNTVPPDSAGTNDPSILGLLDLEVWGAPISAPMADPNNPNFIYQRFQRGVMHFDLACGCTQGLLLADYLKGIITGENLPPDLAAQAQSNVLYRSILPGQAPEATVYGAAFTAITTPSPDYGLNIFTWDNPQTTGRDIGATLEAGFTWQKTVFKWRDIEGACRGCFDWSESDRVVRASRAGGLGIIARLDFQPTWARVDGAHNGPPDNDQDYFDFVSAFVDRYRLGSPIGHVSAIEIWNEPNLSREWGDQDISAQSAVDYVRLLSGAYAAANTADPNVIVISAGLSPTGVTNQSSADDLLYLQWMFDAGLKGGVNYDVLGAHGNTQAPCVSCDLDSLPAFPHPSFYFRRVEQLREQQVLSGDADRQIWLLEFGWTTDMMHPDYSWFAVSQDQQAANIVEAYRYARANWSPWIGVMTLWTLIDPTWNPDREEYWWAINNSDGTPRPAYTAVQTARFDGTLPR